MLDFILSLSKYNIYPHGMSKIKFALKNTSEKTIHCLTYKFKTFWKDKVVDDFSPHEFFFNLNPDDAEERKFGEVDICNTYLAGNTAAGEYEIKVWIRYFICGENEIREVASTTKLFINEEIKENVEV